MKINKKLSLKKKDVAVLNENEMRNVKGGGDTYDTLCTVEDCFSIRPTHCASDNCPTNTQVMCGTQNCTNVAACFHTQFRCE